MNVNKTNKNNPPRVSFKNPGGFIRENYFKSHWVKLEPGENRYLTSYLKSMFFEEKCVSVLSSTCKGFVEKRGVIKWYHSRYKHTFSWNLTAQETCCVCFLDQQIVQNGFRGVKIDTGHGISILTTSNQFFMFPEPSRSRTVHCKCVNYSCTCGPERSRVSHSLYTLNKTTPESMCVSTSMILTRKLKISESVIRKSEIVICPLVIHLVTYGLLQVSPDLCNYPKLTSETSKSNRNR